jgi:hypothetical protein
MKAEHRKELHTNTLADNLGRMIQGSRSMSRRTVLIVVLVVGLLLGFWVWRVIQNNNLTMQAETYYVLDQGNIQDIQEYILRSGSDSEPSKLAHFQIAWILLWKRGIEPLAADPHSAKDSLLKAKDTYEALAEQTKNDPVLAAEAHYALALIEETLVGTEPTTAARSEKLTLAQNIYRSVEKEFQQTAHGNQAKVRADYLEKNRAQVLAFYDQMASRSPPDIGAILRQLQQQKQKTESESKDQKK